MRVEEGRDGPAQEGRVVARQRSHDQHLRLGRGLTEGDHAAEGPLPDDALRRGQIEGWLGVGARRTLEQFTGGRYGPAVRGVGEGAERIPVRALRCSGYEP